MPEPMAYAVFARKDYSEPLTQVGRIEQTTEAAVRAAATQQFGDEWLELVAIPESRLSWAIREA